MNMANNVKKAASRMVRSKTRQLFYDGQYMNQSLRKDHIKRKPYQLTFFILSLKFQHLLQTFSQKT